jgi:hypothetical protein
MKTLTADKERLIRQAVADWRAGTLPTLATLVVIDSLLNPVPVTLIDQLWAKEQLKALQQ